MPPPTPRRYGRSGNVNRIVIGSRRDRREAEQNQVAYDRLVLDCQERAIT